MLGTNVTLLCSVALPATVLHLDVLLLLTQPAIKYKQCKVIHFFFVLVLVLLLLFCICADSMIGYWFLSPAQKKRNYYYYYICFNESTS
jgi:hypothetical protein